MACRIELNGLSGVIKHLAFGVWGRGSGLAQGSKPHASPGGTGIPCYGGMSLESIWIKMSS